MPLKDTATVMTYRAWDKSANAPKTGDAANHTIYIAADGVPTAVAASPVEVDATNFPGLYRITVAAGENIGTMMALGGVSSTADVDISPVQWTNQVDVANLSAAVITQIKTAIQDKANDLADAFLGRSVSNVEATAAEHSMCTIILLHTEAETSGTALQIYQTDGSTAYLTKTLTLNASALPIIAVE
ncbi:MAG: hypothetical protein ABL309_13900 [Phycisphaerales bacterium]